MNFPLELRFKILALGHKISVTDATGHLLCYVKQKMFKLKEAVTIFADEAQTRPLYTINADRVLDISARYRIAEAASGAPVGVVQRRGMKSIWRATYEIYRDERQLFQVQEENPWAKVFDRLFAEIPVVGIFAGYVFHPVYGVTRTDGGGVVLRVHKQPAFLEGKFRIEQVGALTEDEQRLVVLSLVMMLLLERRRG